MERGLFRFSVLLGFISFLFYFTDFFLGGGGWRGGGGSSVVISDAFKRQIQMESYFYTQC